jgi:hypothetical protein
MRKGQGMLRSMGLGLALVAGLAGGWAHADEAAPAGSLTDPSAFERAYGASFYGFDACGESLTGKEFRSVLADKFAHCPFTAEARQHFARWTRGQRAKSTQVIQDMIIEHGGLPVRLDGMALTCHEQFMSPANQQLRAVLDRYQQGQADANAILPGACDAAEIAP